MNRIVGIETEYGCLVSDDKAHAGSDAWPTRVKNYLFKKANVGSIDLHYRDYEEPPGNGGFLLNGGRLYLDMGHLEYSSPECLDLRDIVSYDLAGDALLQSGLEALGVTDQVSFLKNNIDHHTGATFGCHENYLMKREAQFTPQSLGSLLSFLATRQVFTGAGRVGQANPLAFDFELPRGETPVDYQVSQRADHIVNDIYQWVQFNRAIINARDEPLADYRKYRRLHLLIGDSNMSPFATALKVGTTACVLTLLEEGLMPYDVILHDAVQSTRDISRDQSQRWVVRLEDGRTCDALDVQYTFLKLAQQHLGGKDEETDWLIERWGFTLDAIRNKPEALIGGVDWISKKWLLDAFREEENLSWQDPWMQSLDLEYHNINPEKGLFFALNPAKAIGEFNASVRSEHPMRHAPANTRAWGRGAAVAHFQQSNLSYVINWDSISCENQSHFPMSDPFQDYEKPIQRFFAAALTEVRMNAAREQALGGATRWVGWLAVALTLLAGVTTARAHDFWLEAETLPGAKGEELLLHLRMGDQFRPEEERPLQKDHVARFDLFSDRTRRRDLLATGQEGQVPVAKLRREPGTLLAVMDRTPRPITMEHDRFNRYLQDEEQEAVLALRARLGQGDQPGREVYTRYLKALVQDRDPAGATPSTMYKRRVGQRLELLLENDPGRMRPGVPLTVKALFEGKPLAGAKVFAYRRGTPGQDPVVLTEKTSAQGLAEFKLDEPGLWLVRMVHIRVPTERKPESTAPWESFWASYCFTVRPAPVPGAVTPSPKDG